MRVLHRAETVHGFEEVQKHHTVNIVRHIYKKKSQKYCYLIVSEEDIIQSDSHQ